MKPKRGLRVLVAASLLLGTLVAVARDFAAPTAAHAIQATGGAARFKAIEWFSWGAKGAAISNSGVTRTEQYTVAGQTLAITCRLSNIARQGSGSGTYLVSYVPGTWQGDGFDELYNIGGTGTNNTMAVGLGNRNDSNTITLDFSCSATLGGNPFSLAGLVMADAEASGGSEYVGATITSGTWRILDRVRGAGCALDTYARRTVTGTANRLELYGPEDNTCESNSAQFPGPSAVAFMDGVTSATNVTIAGGGKSAIALGVALDFDFGDAPTSYGEAGAALQYGYTGGEIPITTSGRGTPVFGNVTLANSSQPTVRLGRVVDPESSQYYSSDALGDDTTGNAASGGPDDEDALTVPNPLVVSPGGTRTISGVACNATTTAAGTVAGWIDWNRNGTFETGERSTNTPSCPAGGGTVDLSFAVPSGILGSGGSFTSFLRLRIAPTAADLLSTGVRSGGEVEDHRVVVSTAPRLTVAKTVAGRVSPTDQFTVTMTGAGLPTGGVSATTTGAGTSATTTTQFVQTGQTYTITDTMAAGSANPRTDYRPTIACVDTANSNASVATSGPAGAWSVTNLANGQYVVCTITNTPRPAELSVTKTAGAASGPDADGQYTATYQVSVRNTGALPGTYGALRDVPDFAANLVVDGASWTTSGTGAPPAGSANGAGPFTLAPAGTAIARDTTHAFSVTVRFHYTNRTNATTCNGSAGRGLYNRATVPSGQESNTDDNSACIDPPAAPAPRLSFDKQAGDAEDLDGNGIDAGDRIAYSFTVTNRGNVRIDNVAVTDDLLPTVTCDATSLAPGASTGCSAAYLLTQADIDTGAVNNIASAAGTDPIGAEVTSADDSTSTTWEPSANLLLDKGASSPADVNGNGVTDAGDRITYTFTVTNQGNATISNVAITDNRVSPVTCVPTTLAPGQSAACTSAPYVITTADMDAGSVRNTAKADGRRPGGAGVESNTDETSTSLVAAPALRLVKRAGTPIDVNHSGITDAGDSIAYTFTVTNTGNVTISGVAVADPRLSGLACVSTVLAPGASTQCSAAPYTVTADDEAAEAAVNRATATGTDPSAHSVTSPEASTTTPVTAPRPRLAIDKTAGVPVDVNHSGITDAGDTIAFTFTVTNTGNVPITGVSVDDPTLSATAISCTAADLAVGASTSCGPLTHTVTEADEAEGSVANAATATGTDPDRGTVTSPSDETSTPTTVPAPALALVKAAGTPVDVNGSGITDAGDTIAYTFRVTNTGNVPLSAVTINDPTLSASPIACAASTLAVGGSTTCGPVDFVVSEADEAAGRVRNTATATATDPDAQTVTSAPSTTSTPVTAPAPALSLVKTAGTPVDANHSGITDAGDTIAFTFAVTNTGNVPITGLAVDDPLLAGLPVTCAATTLAPAARTSCTAAPYRVTAADVIAGSVVNFATVTGSDPDGGDVTSPPATTTTVTTTPRPSLGLAKRAGTPVDVNGSGITDAGDTVAYTFAVQNTGNVPLAAVTIDDPMLAAAGIGIDCPAGSVAPGVTITCAAAAPYVVTDADVTAGAVVNTANADATDPDGDSVRGGPSTTTTATTVPDPRLVLDKTAGTPVDVNHSGITDAGDTIAYSFSVSNAGNVPLSGLTIADPMLTGADPAIAITCSPTTLAPGASAACTTSAAYVVVVADQLAGAVANTAVARATSPDAVTIDSRPDITSTPVSTPRPLLNLVKSAASPVDVNGSGITDAGDTITYSFTVTNAGNVPVSGIAVSDPLLAGQGLAVTCGVTSLAPGASTSCTAPAYTVTEANEDARAVTNVATARGTDPDGRSVTSPPATTTTPVTTPRPRLTIEKTAATPVDVNHSGITDAGDTVGYTFVVSNEGNVPIDAIAVQDTKLSSQGITVTCSAVRLAPGESTACAAAPYTITAADVTAGSATNSATPNGTDPDGDPVAGSADSTQTPVTRPQPLLELEKSAGTPVDVNGSGITDAGDTVGFTFVVTNAGNVPVSGIAVNDPLLAGQGLVITCEVTSLAPGASTSCTAPAYTVTEVDEIARAVTNSATARGTDPDGGSVLSPRDGTTTPTTRPAAALEVEKSAAAPVDVNHSGITDAGDTIVYRFRVTNTGNVPVRTLRIDDEQLAGSTITCTDTRLAPGATTTCTAEPYVVTTADESDGAVLNTATAAAVDPDGDPVVSPPDSETVPVTQPRPALSVAKSAGIPVDVNGSGITDAGDTITYTFTVTNTGNVPLTALTIDDPKVGTVSCPAGSLAPGAAATCTSGEYAVTDADVAAGAVVNTARARATDPDGDRVTSEPATSTVPTTRPQPGMSITKSAGTPVDVNHSGITDAGDTIGYTFTVTNTGNVPIAAVTVVDPKLAGQTSPAIDIECPIGRLDPGETVTCTAAGYVITAADVADGAAVNTATAIGTDPDGGRVESGPASTTTPTTLPQPALLVEKSVAAVIDENSSGITDAGDTVRYSFAVTNTGNVPIAALTVADLTVQPGPISCTVPTLAPGAATVCGPVDYTVTATDVAAGGVTNTATANGVDPDAGTVTSPPDTTSVTTVTPEPQLVIDKAAAAPVDVNNSGITDAGDTIRYSFRVTNTGNVPVGNVTVTDAVLAAQGITIACTPTTLAVDATANCVTSAVYRVTQADVNAGSAANRATAGGLDPDRGSVTSAPDVTSTPTTVPRPSLSVRKFASEVIDNDGNGPDAGDTVTFAFRVHNDGNVPMTVIRVHDRMLSPDPIACTPPLALAPAQEADCVSSEYTLTQADLDAGSLNNTATATGQDPDTNVIESPPSDTSTPLTQVPALTIVKSVDSVIDVNHSGLTDAGDTIGYSYVVSNPGNVRIHDIAVDDPMLADAVPAITITCRDQAGVVSTALDPGGQLRCVADSAFVVTGAQVAIGHVVNVAVAIGAEADGDPIRSAPSTTSTATTQPQPQLDVEKTAGTPSDVNGSGITDAGDTIAYSFRVTNSGNVPVRAIGIADPMLLAAGIPVTCAAAGLDPGASTTCEAARPYVVTAGDVAEGRVENSAHATGVDPDDGPVTSPDDTTTTATTTPQPALSLVKTAGTPVDVNSSGLTDAGDRISYTFEVTNTGNVPLARVTITDPMLALAGIAISCPDVPLAVRGTTTCTAAADYRVTEADEQAGAVANRAVAGATDPDGGPVSSGPATTTTPTTIPVAGMALAKSVASVADTNASGLTDAGDEIRYAFTVTNTGNVPLTSISVSDPLLRAAGIAIACPPDRLGPGLTVTCTASDPYVVTKTDEAAGLVTNVATASGADPDHGAVTSPVATTSTPTTIPAPGLTIDKAVSEVVDVNASGLTDAGDEISYEFTITNTGNVPIAAVDVIDPLLQRAGISITCPTGPLPVARTVTCAADEPYVVTAADVAAGSVENTAWARGEDPDGDSVTSPDDVVSTPTTLPRPGLLLVKTAGTPTDVNLSGITDAGDTIAYTFTVTNTGNVPIRGVAVSDPMLSASPISCAAATLAVGAATTCGPVSYAVTAADERAGAVANEATASGVNPDGGAVTSPEARTSTTVTIPAPSLSLVKSVAGVADVNASGITDAPDEITYSFLVTNTGNVPVSTVAVSDPLLAAQGITITCAPSARLGVGAEATCTPSGPYVVTGSDERSGAVQNRATASALDPDREPVSSPEAITTTSTTEPFTSLILVKSVAGVADVNASGITDAPDEITYSFVVTNNGNVPVSGVSVRDPLLTGQGVTVACEPTVLAPGANATCAASGPYVITAADERAGSVVNSATASADDPDGDPVVSAPDGTGTPTTPPQPALLLVKAAAVTDVNGSGITDAGDTIAYSFAVTNTGNVPVSGLSIDDPMLAAATVPVTCPVTVLGVGATAECTAAVYTVTEIDEAAGGVHNTATARGADPDGDPVTSPPATTTSPTMVPEPRLALDKTAGAPADFNDTGMIDAGDTIIYLFAVTNTGNVPVGGVSVDDPLVGTVDCAPDALAPTESARCEAVYVITQDDIEAGSVQNTAVANAVDPDRQMVTSPTDSTSTLLDRFAGLDLAKSAELLDRNGDRRANAGEVIRYTLVVTNTGNVRVTGIVIHDPMLDGSLSCPANALEPGEAMTCAAEHVVTRAEAARKQIVNVATVTGTWVLGEVAGVAASATVPGSPGSELAYTGAAAWAPPLGLAGVAALLGFVLVGVSRRREQG